MGRGLVGDFPDAVDPQQIVEVDPSGGFVRDGVEAQLDHCGVANLCHRNKPSHNAPARWHRPRLEILRDEVLVQLAVGVDLEDPGVLVEGLSERPRLVVIEAIDV